MNVYIVSQGSSGESKGSYHDPWLFDKTATPAQPREKVRCSHRASRNHDALNRVITGLAYAFDQLGQAGLQA